MQYTAIITILISIFLNPILAANSTYQKAAVPIAGASLAAAGVARYYWHAYQQELTKQKNMPDADKNEIERLEKKRKIARIVTALGLAGGLAAGGYAALATTHEKLPEVRQAEGKLASQIPSENSPKSPTKEPAQAKEEFIFEPEKRVEIAVGKIFEALEQGAHDQQGSEFPGAGVLLWTYDNSESPGKLSFLFAKRAGEGVFGDLGGFVDEDTFDAHNPFQYLRRTVVNEVVEETMFSFDRDDLAKIINDQLYYYPLMKSSEALSPKFMEQKIPRYYQYFASFPAFSADTLNEYIKNLRIKFYGQAYKRKMELEGQALDQNDKRLMRVKRFVDNYIVSGKATYDELSQDEKSRLMTKLLNAYGLFEKPIFKWVDEDELMAELFAQKLPPADPQYKKPFLFSPLKENLLKPESLDILYVLCQNEENRRKIDERAPVAPREVSISVESVHLKDKELTQQEMEKEQEQGIFTFDARKVENPWDFGPQDIKGKKILGTDPRIQEWMHKQARVNQFLRFMKSKARTFIRDCCNKGITNITFRIGCYAGKQRSVFSAEELWKYLKSQKNIKLIGDTPAHKSINEPWY